MHRIIMIVCLLSSKIVSTVSILVTGQLLKVIDKLANHWLYTSLLNKQYKQCDYSDLQEFLWDYKHSREFCVCLPFSWYPMGQTGIPILCTRSCLFLTKMIVKFSIVTCNLQGYLFLASFLFLYSYVLRSSSHNFN